MKIFENKAISLILMVALIAAGTWISGYRGLSSVYWYAENAFFVGEDGDGICIANDLSERAIAAVNMVTLASNYAGLKDSAAAVTEAAAELTAELSATNRQDSIGRLSDRNRKLDTAVTALYEAMGEIQLSEKHEKYRQSLYADFTSRGHTISHDPYNNYAQSYNQLLQSFPAGLLASITPVPAEAVIFY